jgi:hypothetical protein
MITEREIAILRTVCRYYVLNSRQIQRLHFPDDASGRVTRRRLQLLVGEKLINRQQMLFAHPTSGSLGPIYYPSQKGCDLLAAHFDDERYSGFPTKPPVPHHVWHWLAVAETHIVMDQAIARQSLVSMDGWINEYDEVDGCAAAPEKKFRLYTVIRETPRLVCAPDAGFLLSTKGHSKVFYLEQDRATSGTKQVAASKSPGYAGMAEQLLHRNHFPQATVESFTVLLVAPSSSRRDSLRKAMRDKAGAHLWRFATIQDMTLDTVLHNRIWYPADDSPAGALIRKDAE